MHATQEEIRKFVYENRSWFDVEEEDDQHIYLITRDHGDVGEEEPGEEDVKEAWRLQKLFKDTFPGCDVFCEIIDEWVDVSLWYPRNTH